MSQLKLMQRKKDQLDQNHAKLMAALNAKLEQAQSRENMKPIAVLQIAGLVAQRDDVFGVAHSTSWDSLATEVADKGIVAPGVSGEIIRNAWRNFTKKSVTKALSKEDRLRLTEHSIPYLAPSVCNFSALDVRSLDELDIILKRAGIKQGLRSKAFGFVLQDISWLNGLSPSQRNAVADRTKSGIKMCQVNGLFHTSHNINPSIV